MCVCVCVCVAMFILSLLVEGGSPSNSMNFVQKTAWIWPIDSMNLPVACIPDLHTLRMLMLLKVLKFSDAARPSQHCRSAIGLLCMPHFFFGTFQHPLQQAGSLLRLSI